MNKIKKLQKSIVPKKKLQKLKSCLLTEEQIQILEESGHAIQYIQSDPIKLSNGPSKKPSKGKSTKEKIFLCKICDKGFGRKHHLNDHIKYHHEQMKPHPCSLCSESFPNKTSLKNHVSGKHSDERPFKCHFDCSSSFKLKHHLTQHLIKVHKKRSEELSTSVSISNSSETQSESSDIRENVEILSQNDVFELPQTDQTTDDIINGDNLIYDQISDENRIIRLENCVLTDVNSVFLIEIQNTSEEGLNAENCSSASNANENLEVLNEIEISTTADCNPNQLGNNAIQSILDDTLLLNYSEPELVPTSSGIESQNGLLQEEEIIEENYIDQVFEFENATSEITKFYNEFDADNTITEQDSDETGAIWSDNGPWPTFDLPDLCNLNDVDQLN